MPVTERLKTSRISLTLAGALLLGALSAGAPVAAQTPTAPEQPVVVTNGDGVSRAVPDRAFVDVSAESRASSPREAQRKNAELMKPVQDKLRALGIPADAIRTTVINLTREYDYVSGRQIPKGYLAVNSVEVRVDALDKLGELLDAVVTAGATSLGDIRFDVTDRDKYEREALRAAVADARARADAAAAGAGRSVDRILRIEEHGVVAPPMPMARMAMMKEANQAADTPIAAGQMEFRARVSLTMVLK